MVIVFLSTFLENYPSLNGMILMLILGLYMLLCIKNKPYKTKLLNYQAIISCTAMIFTIGIVNYISSSKISDLFKNTTFFLVLVLNIGFLAITGKKNKNYGSNNN